MRLFSTTFSIVLLVLLALLGSASGGLAENRAIDANARTLLETIDGLGSEYRALKAEGKAAKDNDAKAVAELQARSRLIEWMRVVDALVKEVVDLQDQGQDTSGLLQETRKLLWSVDRRLPSFIQALEAENIALSETLGDVPADTVQTIEARISANEESLDETVRFFITHIEHMDRLDLGSSRARTSAAETLDHRAGNLSARLELASQRLEKLLEREDTSIGDESEAQEKFDRIAASLWTVCDALDQLDLPSASYRRVLILATGELTSDVLDSRVLAELANTAFEAARLWFEQRGPVLIGRIARFLGVLVFFWILGRITRRLTTRFVESSGQQMSKLAERIIVSTTSRIVVGIGFLIALSQIGVNVTALVAGLGIVGFIIGFALQETLGNFAAGAMILFYHPFDVGDVIEAAGVMGTVDNMNLVSTTILTFDNQTLIVPNSRIWGDVIRNATALDQRRIDLSFPLALDVDVEQAETLFESICRAHPAVLDHPEPAIKVQEITGAGVLFVVRPWVRTSEYWPTYWDLNREAHVQLGKAGIQIAAARYKLED